MAATLLFSVTATSRDVLAQSFETSLAHMYHQAWGVREGAPGAITGLAQTPDGYLWLTTPAGLYRFDGVRFERFLSDNGERLTDTVGVDTSPDGALWVGHRGAVSRVRAGRVTRWTAADGVPNAAVLRLAFGPDGDVWVMSSIGTARLDQERWIPPDRATGIPPGPARAMHFDADGGAWLASGDGLLRRPPGGSRFEPTDFAGSFGQIARSADGTLWAASITGTVLAVGRRDLPQHHLTAPVGWRELMFDRRGALWIAGGQEGLRYVARPFTGPPKAWHDRASTGSPAAGPDLTGDEAFDLLEDREGNVWVATNGGLDLFRETPLVSLMPGERVHGARLLADPAGGIWIGSQDRPLMHVRDGARTTGLVPGWVTSLARGRDGAVWAAADGALWRGHAGRFARVADLPAAGNAWSLAVDATGRLWTAMLPNGLFWYRDGQWSRASLPGLPPDTHRCRVALTDDAGRVWLGFADGSVTIVDGDRASPVLESAAGLGSISSIAVRRERAWIGGAGGVALVRGTGAARVAGLNEATVGQIKGIVEAADGSLWLNADRGIVRVAPEDVARVVDAPSTSPPVRVFDYLDGVIGGAALVPAQAAIADRDGRLWFVAYDGILSVDPGKLAFNAVPPPVYVRSIRAGATEYGAGDGAVRLPVATSSLSVSYTALSLTMPDRVRFKYLLDGVDPAWQDAGTRREAFYTNLGPGRYTFRVIASNNDGLWNDEGASIAFVIPAAWHQTTAARLAAMLTAALLGWALYRRRLRHVTAELRARVEERAAERERIARELHDTLLQGVQGLILKFQAVAARLPPEDPTAAALETTLQGADQVMADSRDRVRNLRAPSVTAPDLAQALHAMRRELVTEGGPDVRVDQTGDVKDLHPIVREEAYWIGREALLNAWRHARASRITVVVDYGAREFSLRCEDDGIGVSPDVLSGRTDPSATHWGLSGMRERARRIGGHVAIASRPGASTEVRLRVPATTAYDVARRDRAWWLRPRRRPAEEREP